MTAQLSKTSKPLFIAFALFGSFPFEIFEDVAVFVIFVATHAPQFLPVRNLGAHLADDKLVTLDFKRDTRTGLEIKLVQNGRRDFDRSGLLYYGCHRFTPTDSLPENAFDGRHQLVQPHRDLTRLALLPELFAIAYRRASLQAGLQILH